MMHDFLVWDSIQKPTSGYNVRKVDAGEMVTAYFGKDASSSCLLIIELEGDFSARFKKDRFSLNGIVMDLRSSEQAELQNVVFSLQRNEDKDIFQVLCKSMLSNLTLAKNMDSAYQIIFTHLRRWRDFLSGARKRLLSMEEIRGLFAELECLKLLLSSDVPTVNCLSGWTGPDKLQQDFMLGKVVLEVKSTGVRDKNTIRISSENQLESLADKLYLVVYTLHECIDPTTGKTLNQQVQSVVSMLNDTNIEIDFSNKLAEYGYVEIDEYDRYSFSVANSQSYDVSGNFPRLVRSKISDGLVKVNYDIEIEKLEPFKCRLEFI